MDHDFFKEPGHLIAQLNRRRKRFMSEHLKPYGINGSMYMFILAINRHPGSRQDFLAEHLVMDKGNVARAAKKLTESGFLERVVDPEDRRQYQLFLTERGRLIVPEIRGLLSEWSNLLLADFSGEESIQAENLLRRMLENSKLISSEIPAGDLNSKDRL